MWMVDSDSEITGYLIFLCDTLYYYFSYTVFEYCVLSITLFFSKLVTYLIYLYLKN